MLSLTTHDLLAFFVCTVLGALLTTYLVRVESEGRQHFSLAHFVGLTAILFIGPWCGFLRYKVESPQYTELRQAATARAAVLAPSASSASSVENAKVAQASPTQCWAIAERGGKSWALNSCTGASKSLDTADSTAKALR